MLSEIYLPFPIPGPLGPIHSLSTFSILLVIAFLVCSYLAPRELARRGLRPEISDWSVMMGVIGTLVGAKLGFVLEIWDQIWIVQNGPDGGIADTIYHLLLFREGMGVKVPGAVGLWQAVFSGGGLVFYGGLLMAILLIWLQLRYHKVEVWRYGDVYFMMLALGYSIGRLGCWVSGDGCYGVVAPVHLPLLTWVFGPDTHMSTRGVRVWNTPVIESILSLLLFSWMMLRGRFRAYRPGFFAALFLIYDGLARFLVEFLRLNDALIPILPHPTVHGVFLRHHNDWPGPPDALYFQNWHWYGFTESQVVGLFLAAAGILWMIRRRLYVQDDPASSRSVGAP